MKKLFFVMFFAALVLSAEAADKNNKQRPYKGRAVIGMSYMLLSPDDGKNMNCAGVTFGGGGYVTKRSRFDVELSILGLVGDGRKIGTFSYTQQINNGPVTTHHDGVIRLDFTAVPIIMMWNFEMNVGKKTYFYVGPAAGIMILTSKHSYTPNPTDGSGKSNSETKAALSYGANIGFDVNILPTISLGLGYRLLGNTKMNFERSSPLKLMGHQISVNFSTRF